MKYIWKDTLKSIKKSLSKFITLTCIVMLGVSFFVGLQAAPPSMQKSIDTYDDSLNLHDYQLISTLGFVQEDIDKLLSNEYVSNVEPYYFVDAYTKKGTSKNVIRLEGNGNTIDQYTIVSGRDIQAKDEVILLYDGSDISTLGNFENSMPAIGDTVTVFLDDEQISDSISTTSYTVVGYYQTSKYITKMLDTSTLDSQMLSYVGIIDQSNFIMEAIPSVVMTLNNALSLDSFTKDYKDYIDEASLSLDPLFTQGPIDRTNSIKDEANQELNDARTEYEDGVQTFNDEIEDAQNKINDGQQELNDAYQELIDGQKELDTTKQDTINELHDAEKQINDGKAELEEGKKLFEEEKAKALQQLENAKNDLDSKNNTLISGKEELFAGLNTIFSMMGINFQSSTINSYNALFNKSYELAASGITDQNEIFKQTQDLQYAFIKELVDSNITNENIIGKLSDDMPEIPDLPVETADSSSLQDNLIPVLPEPKTLQDAVYLAGLSQGYWKNREGFNSFKESSPSEYVALIHSVIDAMQAEGKDFYQTYYSSLVEQLKNNPNQPIDLNELMGQVYTVAIGEGSLKYGYEACEIGKQQALDQLASAQKQLDQANALLVESSEELIQGWEDANQGFADGQAEIDDGWNQYYDGISELEDAKQELEDAKIEGQQELDDAKQEIDKAQQEIDDIEDCEWIVLDRGSHYSSVMYTNTITTMSAIGALFPLFFILVAMLVCLTTMTRMVEEERTLIGTYRSLGFSQVQSCAKFLIYALLASIIGCIFGSILGLLIFPIIIYNAWGMMYFNPEFILVIPWKMIFLISLMFIVLMLGTTYYSCRENMKEVPAQLMRPQAPKKAKKTFLERIPFIWNHLNFTMKVTVRNLMRYKKRFFMTVLGVGGCTSLMVCGFGVRDAVSAIGTIQYGELYKFDASITFDGLDESEFIQKRNDYLALNSVNYEYPIYFTNVTVKGNVDQASYLYVLDIDEVNHVFELKDAYNGNLLELNDNGIIISKRLSQYYGVGVGDTLTLNNNDDQTAEFVIQGICEMYVYHHIFMTPTAYENGFGNSIVDNTIAVSVNDEASLTTAIQTDDSVSAYQFASTVIAFVNDLIGGFAVIVIVLVASAAALAFVVLGNLTSVNISERFREIATLKVLGFTKREVHHYVYYENIILTMIGGVVGLWFGRLELTMIMQMIQMDNIAFGNQIKPLSYLVSYIITLVFAMLVNRLMQRHLDDINMVESLKSIE